MDFGLTPEAQNVLFVALYLIGAALRVAWPYVLAYLEDGVKFDVNFLIGQIAAVIIGLLGIMSADSFVAELGALGYLGALIAGYGAASIGRVSQKTANKALGK